MAQLKVLLTVHQFFPRWYHGTERYTVDLATQLTQAWHEVVILTASHVPAEQFGISDICGDFRRCGDDGIH